jgi:itaconate CoA-transferase
VLVAVQNEREWAKLCEEVLQRPDLARDPRFQGNPSRVAHRELVDGAVQEGLAKLSTAEVVERLRQAGVAFGRLNDIAAFAEHPALRLTEVELEAGMVRMPAVPVVWREREEEEDPDPSDPFLRIRVPKLGEHGAELRSEFAPGSSAGPGAR